MSFLILVTSQTQAMPLSSQQPQKLVTDEGPDTEYLLLDHRDHPVPGDRYGWLWSEQNHMQVQVFWDDSEEVLDHGAGTCMSGVMPGSKGPVILAGHVLSYFNPLQFLQKGDLLHLDTWYGLYDYEITDIEVYDEFDLQQMIDQKTGRETGSADPEDVRRSRVFLLEDAREAGSAEELIIYTCYPFYPTKEEKTDRYTLIAKKVAGPSVIWVDAPQVIYSEED